MPGEGCHGGSSLQPAPQGLQENICLVQARQIIAGSKQPPGCRQSTLLFANCKPGLRLKASRQYLVLKQ